MGECITVIRTTLAFGPFLIPEMKFCPGMHPTILGMGVMNQYAKAHPELLKLDGPEGDRLFMLLSAFREVALQIGAQLLEPMRPVTGLRIALLTRDKNFQSACPVSLGLHLLSLASNGCWTVLWHTFPMTELLILGPYSLHRHTKFSLPKDIHVATSRRFELPHRSRRCRKILRPQCDRPMPWRAPQHLLFRRRFPWS